MFSPTLADLHFSDVSDQGRLSPRARLTLSKTDKRIANIPLAASSVAFVYPLPDLADALSLTDMAQPAVALISIGGYVYWDDAGNIVGVNSLSLGPGLNFAVGASHSYLQPHAHIHPCASCFRPDIGSIPFASAAGLQQAA